MPMCEKCKGDTVRNGVTRGQQRYLCKRCGYNFVEGDARVDKWLPVRKALAMVLYSLNATSYARLGGIFGVSKSLIHAWIREQGKNLPTPEEVGSIKEMELKDLRPFLSSVITHSKSSKPWIVAHGPLLPGWSAIVLLQRSTTVPKTPGAGDASV
jgi:transposase